MNAETKFAPSLASAMAQAFAEIEGATKAATGQVGRQEYKYADLTAVIAAIKPALINHGLFFTQHPVPSENGITIETHLHHAGGEHMALGSLFVPANKHDAQGYGSALTYARRYALVTAFGVPVEDDDGRAAVAAGGRSEGRAVSPRQSSDTLRDQLEQSVEQEVRRNVNWGGRYPTKTALKKAMHLHHLELERIGVEGTFDDLDGYLTSPEYQDYITQAGEHHPLWLGGDIPPALAEQMPTEFIQTFKVEQKARDMIAMRGNVPNHPEKETT